MKGEISFDTEICETGEDFIEGCFRTEESGWNVFYFTHWRNGEYWQQKPDVRKNVTWPSGISGVEAVYPSYITPNKTFVKLELSRLFAVKEWIEVYGPDSLLLK